MTKLEHVHLHGRTDEKWKNRTVLVTGGAGFFGGHMIARLTEAGAVVHATTRAETGDCDRDVRWSRLDLEDASALDAVVDAVRPDVVFHLGGRVSAAVEPALVAPTFHSLLASSVTLLEAARAGRVGRLVLVGSSDEPRGADAPTSPYSAAKATVTSYAKLFATAFDTPVVVVRPTETFGPGQAAGKLLPHVARSALRGERPRLSSGRRRGDWVFVEDVVDGFLLAANKAPDGAELDLGTGRLRSNREVVEGLLRALGSNVVPLWGALPDRPAEPEHAADVEHTAQLLGWRATTALEVGLRITAARAATEWADTAPGGTRKR